MVRGKIKNGRVLLQDGSALPEGTEVEVRPVKKARKPAKAARTKRQPPRSLAERMAPVIGIIKDLPPDMSVNLDHYLYGHPKQE